MRELNVVIPQSNSIQYQIQIDNDLLGKKAWLSILPDITSELIIITVSVVRKLYGLKLKKIVD